MILALHGVFLGYLALLTVWNVRACGLRWERRLLLPALLLLDGILLFDRVSDGAPLLPRPAVAALFPLAFALALIQNAHAMASRGPRLSDIPLVLYNVGLAICTSVGWLAIRGEQQGRDASILLYDHSVLQMLLGTPIAQSWTLSWHVPVLCSRRQAESLPSLAASLVVPALCAFVVASLALFHRPAQAVIDSFGAEPRLATREDLAVGILAAPPAIPRQGTIEAWEIPADQAPTDLPIPTRPLLLALTAPRSASPDAQAFLDGAERLAAHLHPAVLLPFPEPDGEAARLFGMAHTPAEWASLYAEARARIRRVSPGTRVGARMATLGHELFVALAGVPVEILGPRLAPAGEALGGAAWADTVLETWAGWREQLPSAPALWILGAGCSALACGEEAQARFVEGCLARAQADGKIEGILIDAREDRWHTLALRRQLPSR